MTSPPSDERDERSHERPLARALNRELGTHIVRDILPKIVPAEDRFARSLDCEIYSLAKEDIIYIHNMARGFGRLRKDVSSTFGPKTEWDGVPSLGVLELLGRFVKKREKTTRYPRGEPQIISPSS